MGHPEGGRSLRAPTGYALASGQVAAALAGVALPLAPIAELLDL